MRRLVVLVCVFGVVASASAQIFPRRPPAGGAQPPAENVVPDCVTVRAESRSDGVGFTHVVMVENRCRVAVRCELSTDADPTPAHPLRLRPGQSDEVVTRVSSPAPGVQARARCQLEGAAAAPPPPRAD